MELWVRSTARAGPSAAERKDGILNEAGDDARTRMKLRSGRGHPLVMHMPDAHDRYQRLLIAALNASGVSSGLEVELTPSATLNLLLGPLRLVLFRWRGTRIIHLHYLFKYSVGWANGAVSRRVLRWWFGVWLLATRVVGLRLIWTAHNILPHESIFDDDDAARRMLIRRTDAIIALSEYGRSAIRSRFGVEVAAVIPPGVTLVSAQAHDRGDAAARRDASRTMVTFIGRVTRYKGVDLLLAALAAPSPTLVVRIAGECREQGYASELTAAAERARAAGVDVVLELRQLTDDEYAARLSATDFAIFPFRSITNSETVMTSLSCGVPVLIPGLDAFGELPEEAVLKWQPDDGSAGIRAVLEAAILSDNEKRQGMRSAALAWAGKRSWSAIADATRIVYEQALAGGVK